MCYRCYIGYKTVLYKFFQFTHINSDEYIYIYKLTFIYKITYISISYMVFIQLIIVVSTLLHISIIFKVLQVLHRLQGCFI